VLSLIGWRIDRRSGHRGVLVFLACVAAYRLLRDKLGMGAANARRAAHREERTSGGTHMVSFSIDQSMVFSLIAAPLLFALSAYFTRATPRRVAGALVGGLGFGAANLLWDVVAYHTGWWHYPFTTAPYAALPLYLADGLFYGSTVGLIGWRVTRRFGPRGLLLFLALFTIYGSLRDVGGAAATHNAYILFGAGMFPVLADAASWLVDQTLAQGLMRLVAGPAASDPLARPGKGHKDYREQRLSA
jgi:hypothetical protein